VCADKSPRLGSYISTTTAGETVRAFLPPPLPPDPPLDLSGLYQHLDRANQALGRLDGLTTLLPDTRLFLYLYVRKEALLSSQIEGTKSSFSDLLLFENEAAPGVPIDDVEEVSNYVAATQHGLRRIKGGFPLSLRLIREIHAIRFVVDVARTRRREHFVVHRTGLAVLVREMHRSFRPRRNE
jgi:Fic family protein